MESDDDFTYYRNDRKLFTEHIDALEEIYPVLKGISITAEETQITIPFNATFSDTPTPFLTSEDMQNIIKLYINEREENKRMQLVIENYGNKLIKLNNEYKKLVEKINETTVSFEEQIAGLTENIKELEEARTRKFKLPESWIIEDEDEDEDL